MNIHRWLHEHSLKLLAIRDTPEAIAGGVAIGIYFGFSPLFGFKTLLAIFFAWLTRSNILAAVLASALHDIILPFMPVVYWWEYEVGYYLLRTPHEWPHKVLRWEDHPWRDWRNLFTVGKPLLFGSFICGTPFAFASFLLTRRIVARHQTKRRALEAAVENEETNPS